MRFFSNLTGWKIGLATMALLPRMAILEMFEDFSSNYMLTIEFIFYAAYAFPSINGVEVSQGVLKVFVNRVQDYQIRIVVFEGLYFMAIRHTKFFTSVSLNMDGFLCSFLMTDFIFLSSRR